MPSSRRMDQLPVELLHILFNYFSASELLFTFHNVNDYINATLKSYANHHLNLRSISKTHLRRICLHIRPEQVVSLTLSDGDDTPGLSEILFSRFRMEQFIRLRSLTLIEIEFNSLESIFSHLHKLDELRALSFDDRSIRYLPEVQPVSHDLRDVHMNVLSRLNRLRVNKGAMLTCITFPYLRHLELEQCSDDELQIILHNALQLKSLSVCLNLHWSHFELIIPPNNQLAQLSIEIKNNRISMSEMAQFLLQLPSLKHLELRANVKDDVANGYQWQVLATSLTTFHFKFNVSLVAIGGNLKSFCTPFWLEEKCWFVAYEGQCLFSVPYFAPRDIDITRPVRIRSTAPNGTYLYNDVNKIAIEVEDIKHHYYFPRVQTLELGCIVSLRKIQLALDLNHIEHLVISSMDNLLLFMPLNCTMPRLHKLTFKECNMADVIEPMRSHRLEQILQLKLSEIGTFTDDIIEELFYLFPFVQHLEVEHYRSSEETMIRWIDGFKHLSNASFRDISPFVQQSPQLRHTNFTYRICRMSVDRVTYHWWIDEHISQNERK